MNDAEEWNSKHPVGTRIAHSYHGGRDVFYTVTISPAETRGGKAAVNIEGAGFVLLSQVRVVSPEPKEKCTCGESKAYWSGSATQRMFACSKCHKAFNKSDDALVRRQIQKLLQDRTEAMTNIKKAYADLPKDGYSKATKNGAPTERQLAILEIIKQFIKENGFSPTVRELSKLAGIKSSNGIDDQLVSLRKKGLVTWVKYKARTLRVVDLEEADALKAIEEQEKAADAEARALSEASLEP